MTTAPLVYQTAMPQIDPLELTRALILKPSVTPKDEGALGVPGATGGEVMLRARQGGVLGGMDDAVPGSAAQGTASRVTLRAAQSGGRALLLAARPIGEPVVQYGPFVMNTREEIDQAIRDFQSGRLAAG